MCTHSQDVTVPLHKVSQLIEQPATAQRVQAAPWGAPLEGDLCGLHRLVYVGLKTRVSVSSFAVTAFWENSAQLSLTENSRDLSLSHKQRKGVGGNQ